MQKIVLISLLSCSVLIHASHDLSRDLFAYNYHARKLNKVWYQDRLAKPSTVAGYIGLASFLGTLYILNKLGWTSDHMQDVLLASGTVGVVAYLGSLFPLLIFKTCLRLFIKNPAEEGLRQTLLLLSSRLKNAIANGQITVEDLECHCAGIDSPFVRELVQYARVLRASQMSAAWGTYAC